MNGFSNVMSPPPLGLPPAVGPDGLDAFHQFIQGFEVRQGHARQEIDNYQEHLRRVDREREESYNHLMHMYKQLLDKYTQKCEDFDNEVESRRNWHRQATEHKRQLDQLNLQADSSPFAAVILDGDGAVFNNDLLAKGHEGGVEAAHMLLSNIKNQLKNIYPNSNIDDWSIVCQIALSIPGLGRKLTEVGLISNIAQLNEFIHGFNYSQPLFSIVDVGRGNQRADGKCREMARLMAKVKQCKHLFFGPCQDLGYVPALQGLRDPFGGSQRLTLVECLPALPGFRELQLPFTRFTVFRSESLPNTAPRVQAAPTPQPRPTADLTVNTQSRPPVVSSNSAADVTSPTGGGAPLNSSSGGAAGKPSTSYAAMSKTGAVPTTTISIAPKKQPTRKYYLVNKDNERVDDRLPNTDPAAEKRYFARRKAEGSYCNEHYLKGTCDPTYCKHVHGAPLPKPDLLVLQNKARGLACVNASNCEDVDCYYGHHCKYGRHCTMPDCRFSHLHYVDTNPAYRIYEDGTEEAI